MEASNQHGKTLIQQMPFWVICWNPQASLNMLTKNISLICITLHPLEIEMINEILIKITSKILYPKLLDEERLDGMISQQCIYQMTFEQEQKNLLVLPITSQ
ncbi:hypothetical protein [Pedobacter mendelii]|uniref:hypothetical protein n=1 Tax=Pedobacter mendelii TaxID=1908240 RepID=UPI00166E620F|nr:hypothetical protein [Pedobacter mendelii]